MKATSKIVIGLRNVGRPNDSEEFEGTVIECFKWLGERLLKLDMSKRIDVSIARSQEEVQLGLNGRNNKANSIDGVINELFSPEDFMNELDEIIANAED